MTMLKKTIVAILGFVALAAGPSQATTLARMSLEQLAAAADAVVKGRCLGNQTRSEAGEVWTFSSFEVEEAMKGIVPRLITVRLLGGHLGRWSVRVEGVPEFQPGEEVILFLQRTRAGEFAVTSWMQGTFRVQRDAQSGASSVTQDSSSLAVFDPATRSFRREGVRRAPLGEFRKRLDAILTKQKNGRQP
jgi:hypothetical protein